MNLNRKGPSVITEAAARDLGTAAGVCPPCGCWKESVALLHNNGGILQVYFWGPEDRR